jgi:protein-disulfide isomerase-like protein with CxxC motif
LDLRIRTAFFAESADLGRRDLYPGLAGEVGLEVPAFTRLFESERPRAAVLEEGRLGKEQYGVRGTPTVMLSSGKRLRHPIAFPAMRDDLVTAVQPLPCCGEGCYAATRALFEQALVE